MRGIQRMDTAKLLKDCFLCRELDTAELHELAEIVIIRSLNKGEQLFWEGDKATGFFVLLRGRMRVFKASPEGKEFTIHQIDPGQMFAEAAIFSRGGFPANAAALIDSTVAFFPKDRFLDLIGRSPQISLKMIAGLAKFVREFNQHVENLSLKEVPARLAGFLLDEHLRTDSAKIILNTPKA